MLCDINKVIFNLIIFNLIIFNLIIFNSIIFLLIKKYGRGHPIKGGSLNPRKLRNFKKFYLYKKLLKKERGRRQRQIVELDHKKYFGCSMA